MCVCVWNVLIHESIQMPTHNTLLYFFIVNLKRTVQMLNYAYDLIIVNALIIVIHESTQMHTCTCMYIHILVHVYTCIHA